MSDTVSKFVFFSAPVMTIRNGSNIEKDLSEMSFGCEADEECFRYGDEVDFCVIWFV